MKEAFTDSTGTFQRSIYVEFIDDVEGFLAARGYPPEQIETVVRQIASVHEVVRRDLLREAVSKAVTASFSLSTEEAFAEYSRRNRVAIGRYAALPASLIPDDEAVVAESEALAYFTTHQSEFPQRPSREIRFSIFLSGNSREDSGAVARRVNDIRRTLASTPSRQKREELHSQWLQTNGPARWSDTASISPFELPYDLQSHLKDARTGAIIGPLWLSDGMHLIEVLRADERGSCYVRAQHILLKAPEGEDTDSVQALAGALVKRARGGESFDRLARDYSADPSSKDRGGDLGYFAEGMMVESFEKASFGAQPGTIVGPVRTTFGYHVIKVNERGSKSVRLRDWRLRPTVSASAREAVRRRAESFRNALLAGSSIDSIDRAGSVPIYESGPDRRNDPVAGSIKLGRFAWSGPVGSVSDLIDHRDGSIIVAQITGIVEAGTRPYADERERIMERLRTERKLDLLSERATRLRARFSSGSRLGDLKNLDSGVRIYSFHLSPSTPPEPTFDRRLLDSIFGQKAGVASPALRGEKGYYIVRLDSLALPTEMEFARVRDQFIEELSKQRRLELFIDWMAKRREEARITVAE
jgi:hypothetical protein